ncbi:hypothetical protein PPACK8108_LOCUS2133 [Phakopsora pachyrhizi]|uniref:KRAB-related domain-containing protein n=1 Tax=Phakopsora pachyrhizi TaxID=170000 RepID=A0AAV0AK91_PHAPC|nr:hypothetical protein PPACK8108_LOCUS2133 [Phakopsora pachyrhizi]
MIAPYQALPPGGGEGRKKLRGKTESQDRAADKATTVGRPPSSKPNGFHLMATEINKQSKTGLWLTSKQMRDCFKTYKNKYVKAKDMSKQTGFGTTEEDKNNKIFSISHKLNDVCPCYEDMDRLFGSKPNITPMGDTLDSYHIIKPPNLSKSGNISSHEKDPGPTSEENNSDKHSEASDSHSTHDKAEQHQSPSQHCIGTTKDKGKYKRRLSPRSVYSSGGSGCDTNEQQISIAHQ